MLNSGGPTSQTIGTGFVTAIETFTYHGDNESTCVRIPSHLHHANNGYCCHA